MDIRIVGWEAEGLRGALEDFSIDLSDSMRSNVLIQMPTGTGKTTTMSLLRKAFTGANFTREEIANFRAESGPDSGRFSVSLALDQHKVKVIIDFDFLRDEGSYTTIRVPGGKRKGHDLPEPYNRLLTTALCRLFVFDGELAAELRNRELTRADEAIEALYRLGVLESLKGYADEALDLKQKRNVHVTGKKKNVVTQRKGERDEAKERLGELKGMRAEAVKERELIEAELQTVLEEIRSLAEHTDKLQSEFEAATSAARKSRSFLDECHSAIFDQFVRPQKLHVTIGSRLAQCYSQIEAAKLPGASSAEWFEWLAQQDNCVCGRSISEHERETIRSHMERYLGGEQHGLINEIKFALKAGAEAKAIDNQRVDELNEAAEGYRATLQTLREVENRRVREAGGDIDGLRERQRKLERRHEKAGDKVKELDSSDAFGWRDSIPLCRRELEKREGALNEAEGTYDLFRRVEAFKELLEDVHQGTIAKVRVAIRKRTNEKLLDVIHAERLSIDAIDNALMLAGASRQREDVSVGQSLAIAYAFLTSLFEHASYRLPFVVDSPAGPIDIETRKSVSMLLPKMFHQLIMFVQSGERVGFVESFYERDDVKYVTCWRDDGQIHKVAGRKSFESFHLSADDEPADGEAKQ